MTSLPVLRRSADRKVTNAVSPNGKTAKIANSFGLPSGKAFSCPGATSVCEKVCYAGKLEKIYAGVRGVLLHNWNALNGASLTDMIDMLQAMTDEFRADCDKYDARAIKAGKRVCARSFRIHWDGDFFSAEYAEAWAVVIALNPDIHYWVYTRSFTAELNVVPLFAGIDNVSVYLSVDMDNQRRAVNVRRTNPWVRMAWLGNTFVEGATDMDGAGIEGKRYPCPENKGSIPLITDKGSACIRCNVCVSGKGDVLFSIKKR